MFSFCACRESRCGALTVREVTDQEADRDPDLEEAGEATTDVLRRAFRYVSRRDARDAPNAETCYDAANVDQVQAAATCAGDCLKYGADSEDRGVDEQRPSPSEGV